MHLYFACHRETCFTYYVQSLCVHVFELAYNNNFLTITALPLHKNAHRIKETKYTTYNVIYTQICTKHFCHKSKKKR